jgi:hypothetical protein
VTKLAYWCFSESLISIYWLVFPTVAGPGHRFPASHSKCSARLGTEQFSGLKNLGKNFSTLPTGRNNSLKISLALQAIFEIGHKFYKKILLPFSATFSKTRQEKLCPQIFPSI